MALPNEGARTPATNARAAQVLWLREAGVPFKTIAERLGYRSESGAYNAFKRAMQRTIQEPADELRRLEELRLDALLRAMMPEALRGSTWHVDRVLSIMDRRAKLLGLDGPSQVEVTTYGRSDIDDEITRLLADMERAGQGEAALEAPSPNGPASPGD